MTSRNISARETKAKATMIFGQADICLRCYSGVNDGSIDHEYAAGACHYCAGLTEIEVADLRIGRFEMILRSSLLQQRMQIQQFLSDIAKEEL